MNNMFNNIAILIDADNSSYKKMDKLMVELKKYGRITLKRVYGNWKKEQLKNWEDVAKKYAFNSIQQYDYVKGKNASDIALAVDAMRLLNKGNYDAFVIGAGDSDYTPLAIALKEEGVFLVGVSDKEDIECLQPFINACDVYIDMSTWGKESVANKKEKTQKLKQNKPKKANEETEENKPVEKAKNEVKPQHIAEVKAVEPPQTAVAEAKAQEEKPKKKKATRKKKSEPQTAVEEKVVELPQTAVAEEKPQEVVIEPVKEGKPKKKKTTRKKKAEPQTVEEVVAPQTSETTKEEKEKRFQDLLKEGANNKKWKNEDGFVKITSVDLMIKKKGIDVIEFGFKKTYEYIKQHAELYVFKVEKASNGTENYLYKLVD